MHLLEDLGALEADLEAHVAAEFGEPRRDVLGRFAAGRAVDDHHHVEVVLHDGLRDVEDVDLRVREIRAGLGENTDRVLADDCYDCFFHFLITGICAAATD